MEFQALMSLHQRELIREIDDDHLNPLAAWLEQRLAKSAVGKLLKKHSPARIREVLTALSDSPGFPLASLLWNASHPDVPLHCFFRIRKHPVFRIISIREESNTVEVHMEIMEPSNRRRITLTRDSQWRLSAPSFSKGAGQG